MHTVYGLTDPRNKRIMYIGRTINLPSRMAAHLGPGTGLVKSWISELRAISMEPDVVILADKLDAATARQRERLYIASNNTPFNKTSRQPIIAKAYKLTPKY